MFENDSLQINQLTDLIYSNIILISKFAFYKGASEHRTIEVNHKNNAYRAEVRRLLTSERGLYHRSNRPIEPEAVFGDIKYNHGFKRFRLRSNEKVNVEFGLVALAHNIRKYIALNISKNSDINDNGVSRGVYLISDWQREMLSEAC